MPINIKRTHVTSTSFNSVSFSLKQNLKRILERNESTLISSRSCVMHDPISWKKAKLQLSLLAYCTMCGNAILWEYRCKWEDGLFITTETLHAYKVVCTTPYSFDIVWHNVWAVNAVYRTVWVSYYTGTLMHKRKASDNYRLKSPTVSTVASVGKHL